MINLFLSKKFIKYCGGGLLEVIWNWKFVHQAIEIQQFSNPSKPCFPPKEKYKIIHRFGMRTENKFSVALYNATTTIEQNKPNAPNILCNGTYTFQKNILNARN